MKTKAIFVSLVILLLGLGVNLHRCVCPEEVVSIQKHLRSVVAADICKDCGHTTACCFSHKSLPMVGSSSLISTNVQVVAISGCPDYTSLGVKTSELADFRTNKDPPSCVRDTPISLHRKLLI